MSIIELELIGEVSMLSF